MTCMYTGYVLVIKIYLHWARVGDVYVHWARVGDVYTCTLVPYVVVKCIVTGYVLVRCMYIILSCLVYALFSTASIAIRSRGRKRIVFPCE